MTYASSSRFGHRSLAAAPGCFHRNDYGADLEHVVFGRDAVRRRGHVGLRIGPAATGRGSAQPDGHAPRDSAALGVAQELEAIAYRLRKNLAFHVPSIVKFHTRLKRWEEGTDVSWHELCDRADELLKPALRLSTEISNAYAELLQQMNQLSTFAELRTDPLTGVSNRRAFDESLAELLLAHEQEDTPLSVAMLDLDHFKAINDEQGHLGGDRVLQDLTQLLNATARDSDMVARYGGEEFVVLMPRTTLAVASKLAERLRQRIEDKLPTTISIGVAASLPAELGTSLLARVDTAMYTAKHEGRNCVAVHEGASGHIAIARRSVPAPQEDATPAAAGTALPPVSTDEPAAILPFGHGVTS